MSLRTGTQGYYGDSIPQYPIIVRNPAILTTSYVDCEAHNNIRGINARNGEIDIGSAEYATLWIWPTFDAGQTALHIKPSFMHKLGIVGAKFYQANAEREDGQDANILTISAATGDMKGGRVHIASGGGVTPGIYRIRDVDVANNRLTLDRDFTTDEPINDAVVFIFRGDFQDCTVEYASGVGSIYPAELVLTPSDFTSGELYCHTFRLPAASFMRLAVKGAGVLASSNLILGVTLVPSGS